MARRFEAADSPDDFPTPPWATRALFEHVLSEEKISMKLLSCLEPACGAGHMSKVLNDYFDKVISADAYEYGYGEMRDFLLEPYNRNSVDWIITNPPFRLAESFVIESLAVARIGVAVLTRTVFIESVGRYRSLFKPTPPIKFAQFTERVPMVKGRLDAKASTATGYSWLVWHKQKKGKPELVWIPPSRKILEKHDDYESSGKLIGKNSLFDM